METVSFVSPSLLANIDPDAITHPDLGRTSWGASRSGFRAVCRTCSTARPPYRLNFLGEPVDLGSEQYAGLVQQRGHPTDCRVSDELLMAASQQYEQSSQQYGTYCTEEKLDELFLEASQLLELNRAAIQWL